MEYVLILLPVLLFLMLFYLLDSFKLVHTGALAAVFFSGCLAAFFAYYINTWLLSFPEMNSGMYSRYVAPLHEELLKAAVILVLIKRGKTGFMIDGAIYGFAAGAGFSFAENIYYLVVTPDPGLVFLVIRGLGTAVMHGGTTSLTAVFSLGMLNAEKKLSTGFIPGMAVACFIHSAFNHFYFHPILQTMLIIIVVPSLMILIFRYNEIRLQKWLETEFFSEAELLLKIKKGEFSGSRSGKYMARLKEHFSPETIVDMYCYISLYLELSIKSKRNIMLSECGLPVVKEPDLEEKLREFKLLRKSLGKSGELALSPLMKIRQRNLWQLTKL